MGYLFPLRRGSLRTWFRASRAPLVGDGHPVGRGGLCGGFGDPSRTGAAGDCGQMDSCSPRGCVPVSEREENVYFLGRSADSEPEQFLCLRTTLCNEFRAVLAYALPPFFSRERFSGLFSISLVDKTKCCIHVCVSISRVLAVVTLMVCGWCLVQTKLRQEGWKGIVLFYMPLHTVPLCSVFSV